MNEAFTHQSRETSSPSDLTLRGRYRSLLCFWAPLIFCILAALMVPLAFVLGMVLGNVEVYRRFSEEQRVRIEAYLSQHPEEFADIRVHDASNGWAAPNGTVTSQEDYDQLDAKLNEMFGDELAKRMMSSVDVLE